MKNQIWILFLIFSTKLHSQSLELLNKKFEISNTLEKESECRIYIFEALSRNVNLYRIFNSSSWETEKYKYNIYEDSEENETIEYYVESEIDSMESVLESFTIKHKQEIIKVKGLGKYWKRIIDTGILELPSFENTFFEKTVKQFENGKTTLSQMPFPPPPDGYYYIIQIKSNNKLNQTEINNPKYFISNIPENENLVSLGKFISLIEEIFNIKN